MKTNLFWKYIITNILDVAFFWIVGALIIWGFMQNPNLTKSLFMGTNTGLYGRITLAGASALIWVFYYSCYIPYHWLNGQTLMQRMMGVGVEYQNNKLMTYRSLFFLHGFFGIVAPIVTFGLFVVGNWLIKVFWKWNLTLEEKFVNIRYYSPKEKEVINRTKYNLSTNKNIKHANKKRRRR